ncbi:Cytochrome P450 CYP12A2 [Hondaea fermentalgiana]|uniref:Cytochrome P450 CYP12A2 n=1 Tax=Hondaea fermentalgiana TaxID=2315210 RepID=A0A2R5G847_9STRA|nr:Cytochrome P450 CYP12A2 [Hondaea fermentalgiana]|eukprot:GBG27217.1 Cytochrome P450 CYP12A2 [Hondaea fermentalgiana]
MRDGFDRILDIVRPEVHHLFSQEKMPDCWFKDLRDEQGVPIDQLEVVMGFLLSAAIGTTMSTIEWALVALAHFPREQAKVHAEILATLGGATIFLAPLYQARDTHFISDADQFIPDRYLREKIRERKSCPFSSKLDASVVRNQFGNGSRVCLGKRAAELEVRALVCELLSHYEVVLDPPSQTLPGIAATTVGVPKPFPKLRLLPRKS